MQATLQMLAELVDGTLVGDGSLQVDGAATLRDAASGQISLVDKVERIKELQASEAAAIVAPRAIETADRPMIQVDDVHTAFSRIVAHFHPPRQLDRVGVSSSASVDRTANLGTDVDIHPMAVIGPDVKIGDRATIHSGVQIMAGCEIGEDATIFPGAVLYEGTIVGPRCLIHGGAVLGAYGFGYDSSAGGHQLSAQLGNVVLEADIEIGANSAVDRGTYGPTVIGQGTKIDNLVMIAHNCRIGKHNMLCAQVGIAGSTTTGDYVVMAGQAGVRDHVHIGDGAVLGAMSGVMSNVPDGARVVGIPATAERDQMLQLAAISRLPEMRRRLKKLQNVVDRLVEAEETHRRSDAA